MKDIDVARDSKMRADLGKRVKIFDNEWSDQLDEELKAQFHEKTYPNVAKMKDTSMNIFRRIVREICTVYREPATRTLQDAGENVQAQLDWIAKQAKLDIVMQFAHRYAKSATCSFIMPRVVGLDQKKIILRVLTPEQVYIESDAEEVGKVNLFAYCTEVMDYKKKAKRIWIAYDEYEKWFCDEAGKKLDKDPRTNELYDSENIWGIIPAVAFPAEPQVRSFWSPAWNADAAEANIKIGLWKTYFNYLGKTQSFKQITISADQIDDALKSGILDPLFPLPLLGGASAGTLDLTTDPEKIYNVIKGMISGIANNYGISAENFSLTPNASSGFALKISNQALQDIREADIPLCAEVEQELYRVMATIASKEGIAQLPVDAALSFNPGEVTWPDDWATERDRWEFEFANGISSPVDYLILKDPQLDREAAKAIIAERQAEIKQIRPNMSPWAMLAEAVQSEGPVEEELTA